MIKVRKQDVWITFIVLLFFENPSFATVQVKRSGFIPMAVYADGHSTTRLEVELNLDNTPINTVTAISYYNLLVDGQHSNILLLWDDGSHGDRIAGDHIYTRGGISVPETTPLTRRDQRVDILHLYPYLSVHNSETNQVELAPFLSQSGPGLGIVKSNYPLQAYDVADDIRMSDRVVAVQTAEPLSQTFLKPMDETLFYPVIRRFYEIFQDDYDFLFILPDTEIPDNSGVYTVVSNAVQGIGLEVGNSAALQLGSQGKLKGVARLALEPYSPFLQMIMRQWGVYLSPDFGFGETYYEDSWGLSGVNGVLGGFDPSTMRFDTDGTLIVRNFQPTGTGDIKPYAALELYLAGMLPPESVNPVPVIRGGRIKNVGSIYNLSFDHIDSVTIDQIIQKHGPRIPPYGEAQTDFRAALVFLSNHRAEISELAYFNAIAEHLSQRYSNSETTFYQAAYGGTLDTMIGAFRDPALASLRTPQPTPTPSSGDINADGHFWDDIIRMGRAWKETGYLYRFFDWNHDGVINRLDLIMYIETRTHPPRR